MRARDDVGGGEVVKGGHASFVARDASGDPQSTTKKRNPNNWGGRDGGKE